MSGHLRVTDIFGLHLPQSGGGSCADGCLVQVNTQSTAVSADQAYLAGRARGWTWVAGCIQKGATEPRGATTKVPHVNINYPCSPEATVRPPVEESKATQLYPTPRTRQPGMTTWALTTSKASWPLGALVLSPARDPEPHDVSSAGPGDVSRKLHASRQTHSGSQGPVHAVLPAAATWMQVAEWTSSGRSHPFCLCFRCGGAWHCKGMLSDRWRAKDVCVMTGKGIRYTVAV